MSLCRNVFTETGYDHIVLQLVFLHFAVGYGQPFR